MDAVIGAAGAGRDSAFISGFLMGIRPIIGLIFTRPIIIRQSTGFRRLRLSISNPEEIRPTVHRIGPIVPAPTAITRM
jgi:hypothetical protein